MSVLKAELRGLARGRSANCTDQAASRFEDTVKDVDMKLRMSAKQGRMSAHISVGASDWVSGAQTNVNTREALQALLDMVIEHYRELGFIVSYLPTHTGSINYTLEFDWA